MCSSNRSVVSTKANSGCIASLDHPQKKPSPWTIVAILQALVWWLVLPIYCKSFWDDMFRDLSRNTGYCGALPEMMLNMSGFTMFVLYSLGMLPIYYFQIPFFEQYKISDKPWPWLSLSKEDAADENRKQQHQKRYNEFERLFQRSMVFGLFNLVFLVLLLTWCKYYLKLGPRPSFSTEDWPTYPKLLMDNLLLTAIHEFGFYWTHRLSHTYPWLYRFHKVHHEYKQNIVVAAQHNHPVDYIISIAGPALFSTLIVRPHSFTQFQWTIWVLVANFDDHIGYSFPWSAVRWFPGAATTDMHEFHHSINLGCFASKLNIYDNLFHSDGKYIGWMRTRKQRQQEKQKHL